MKTLLRTVLMVVALLAAAANGAPPAAADEAFSSAKDAYQKLRKDEKRRKFRHHWLNVAKKLETVATKYPKSERAPEALFWSGELYAELSRFSASDEDLDAAQKNYSKVVTGWPKHRLADDAALALARVLADRKGDVAGARKVAAAGLEGAQDQKKALQVLLEALPEAPAPKKPVVSAPAPASVSPNAGAKESKESKEAGPSSGAVAVAEATRRASATVAKVLRAVDSPLAVVAPPVAPKAPVAEARRVAPTRPPASGHDSRDEADADEVVEEPEAPAIATLQEKLRDIRVGVKAPGSDPDARSRFKSLAKTEEAAELTLAQQLGLKVRRVIVDAGHGGHDTGAIGPKGTTEKDATLAISLKLQKKLEAMGLEVLLTRDDDSFVKLEDRTKFANKERGDLFISIHCNAAPSKTLRGVETYTLNTSSNRYSIRLAARENASTERGVGDLQYILADLATKANTGESTRLAERVQKNLIRSLSASYDGVRDLGTKEALFFVLLGAKMPAILVETSFISNPEDEQRLSNDAYQDKIADSVAEAVDGFLEERNKVAQVD